MLEHYRTAVSTHPTAAAGVLLIALGILGVVAYAALRDEARPDTVQRRVADYEGAGDTELAGGIR